MIVTAGMRLTVVENAKRVAKEHHSYVFGGEGPLEYDCSGFTLAMWKLVRVTLRHNSGWQAKDLGIVEPSPSNRSKLLPGDLVAYYGTWKDWRTISHVGLYTGLWRNPSTGRNLRMVAQATDEKHGTEMIYMTKYAPPSGFMFVGH